MTPFCALQEVIIFYCNYSIEKPAYDVTETA